MTAPTSGREYGANLSGAQRVVWVVARSLLRVVAKLWFRYEVHGRDRLPTHGPFIMSPVHRSNLDTPMLPVLRAEPIRFMGKDSLWKTHPLADWLLTTLGGFPVERGAADRGALRAAEEILQRGETLVMFLEGMRRSGPYVLEENVFDGPSFLAGRQQCPIVPIGIGGSEAAMPVGRKFVRPAKMVFVIGEPIEPPQANANGRVSRRAVKEHTETVRIHVQRLYDEATELAGHHHLLGP